MGPILSSGDSRASATTVHRGETAVMDNIARHILGLPGWAALVIVFAVPLLESSAFVGFVFPGEIAVLLGGVLAFQHRVGLPAVLAAAIAPGDPRRHHRVL